MYVYPPSLCVLQDGAEECASVLSEDGPAGVSTRRYSRPEQSAGVTVCVCVCVSE